MILKQIQQISWITLQEAWRGKVLLNTIFLSFGLLIFCYVATKFTFGVPQRIALDIGLGLLTLSSIIIAISLGVGLITNEIQARTIYVVLARSVKRETFIVGKIIGLTLVLALNVLLLGLAIISAFLISGGTVDNLILWSFFYIFLEAELVMLITVLFSLIASKALAIIATISIWLVGNTVNIALESLYAKMNPSLETVLKVFDFIFPAFYRINLKDYVLYNQSLPMDYLVNGVFYVIFYSSCLIVLSCALIKKKNLD